MRLLLDEHYAPEIALHLRRDGADVVAVVERPSLISSSDEALHEWAARECRALVTNNVRDFAPLARRWLAEGRTHHGLLFSSDLSMPRSRSTIGLYVRSLQGVLASYPGDDALRDQARWIAPA